jgi:hypothetical protein
MDLKWEVTVVHAKADIGYHGIASLIPPSHLPTLSVVGEGEVTISIKHVWKQPLGYTCPLQKEKDCSKSKCATWNLTRFKHGMATCQNKVL